MNPKRKKKLVAIILIITCLSIGVGLVLFALKQNINLFLTPTELTHVTIQPNQSVRIGGYVKKASVKFDASGKFVRFIVTDRKNELPVEYEGVLPNLFREGQTVIVTGTLDDAMLNQPETNPIVEQPIIPAQMPGIGPDYLKSKKLKATQVLAKHDEKYMPPALAKKLQMESK